MALTVSTAAKSKRLTSIKRVQTELGISTDEDLIGSLIDAASADVERYCCRPFAREVYSETLAGFGGIHIQLKRTPIVVVSSVSIDGNTVTDYSIADANQGKLYRQNGWVWSVQTWPGLAGSGRFLDLGWPMASQEEPWITVAYTAGYVLPYEACTNSAAAADNSFNDSASGFNTLLRAGDVIRVAGFGNNSGEHIVSTVTAAKIVIASSSTLVTENAGRSVSITTMPADLEKAAIDAVKSYYMTRSSDPRVIEKQAGPMRLRYSEAAGEMSTPLPALCAARLRRWQRAA